MYQPTLEKIKEMAGRGNLAPVFRSINADLETPVSAYLKVAQGPYSFLLESVEGGERIGRYSFIGTDPYKVVKTGAKEELGEIDPLIPVQEEMDQYRLVPVEGLPGFHGGAVGYLAYDTIRYFEPRVPEMPADPVGVPESVFMFCDTLLVFDHVRHDIKVVSHVHLDGDIDRSYAEATAKIDEMVRRLSLPLDLPPELQSNGSAKLVSGSIESNFTREQYAKMIDRCIEYIYAGDMIQVTFSQRFSRRTEAHPFQVYRSLRSINPSPYMYYLNLDGFQIVGAAIETVVTVHNGRAATHPIAGTRPRGATPAEDEANEAELKTSEKQRAEHIMLVDLGRNDIGRVSKPGTVSVTQLMDVEKFSHVMHLVSHVEGDLRPEMTPYDALRSCFPAGTVSGAPKIRAMEIIAELEGEKRGPYGGAVGYFSYSGDMDTALVLRTGIYKDGVMYVQAGGGIVADSTGEDEYMETLHKAGALMRAIDLAEGQE
ncbi:MAG: anthranilate synthase component I [Chloroflexi bacterium]|nr:anthranilate synthase component I [Chloroflexota bacterium]MCI0788084.1 anthranilate synthase component I [Chloroflexota bacterium]MCI0810315.1 anthranilate synthase component I [Chloroflexota bacterium]MCI0828963.1 anthranilate synthase component I [Chloroflexota bacterium]MCI0849093.1 anthranilate synthase component I [Chloroflexota bacterium]